MEELNPKLKAEWNKKLRDQGMTSRLEKTKVPIPPSSASETFINMVPGMEGPLEDFGDLPKKLQEDILSDLTNKRDMKIPPREILNRFELLVSKAKELDEMSAESSDKEKPASVPDEDEKAIQKSVDELIKKMEWVIRRDNFDPKGADKYKN